MKKFTLFIITLAIGSQTISAQNLHQKVSLQTQNQSLEEIFSILGKDYHVQFSFLNNELPKERLDINFSDITLKQALEDLLENFDLEYVIHSGQIIIKRKAKTIHETTSALVSSFPLTEPPQEKAPYTDSLQAVADAPLTGSQDTLHKVSAQDTLTSDSIPSTNSIVIIHQSGAQIDTTQTKESLLDKLKIFNASDTVTLPGETYDKRIVHFGLFYPFSSNGVFAGQYINQISIHLFSGYSAGVEGFEYSSILNITKGNMAGLQITGGANAVMGNNSGTQVAGLTNVVERASLGFQAAGIANVVKHNHIGLQVAGIANVVHGQDSTFLGQMSGIANVHKGHASGFLIAGISNISRNISGVQISGLTNQAHMVKGLQIAPLYNKAYRIQGVQIGLINVSYYMEGVPIGLINIVRGNGYYDLELFYSDDFQANAMFKMGARKFHNIFAFSYEPDGKHRWAYGYGVGSQWGQGNFRVNTDLVSYYVVEKEFPNGGFSDYELNLLNKFRLLPGFHLGDLGFFAGPVLNFMISRHAEEGSGKIGSDITPNNLLLNDMKNGTNFKLWIGYSVGLRI